MNIATLGEVVSRNVRQVVSSVPSSSTGPEATSGSSSEGDSASVSGPARTLSRLQELAKTDPSRFKQVVTQISDRLTTAAKEASSPEERSSLKGLASRFSLAGEAGDVAVLRPGAGGLPGGLPSDGTRPSAGGLPPGSGSTDSNFKIVSPTSSSRPSTEPGDTNDGGTVSDVERQAANTKQAAATRQAYLRAERAYERNSGAGRTADLSAVSSIVDAALGTRARAA